MFPGDPIIPPSMTTGGLTTGMPLFGILRAHFPATHVVVLTAYADPKVMQFFRDQHNCTFLQKTATLPYELAELVASISTNRGLELENELKACPAGRSAAKEYESIIVNAFRYLFIPPQLNILEQCRREDGRLIRDAVMSNDATSNFWASLRQELDAKHIIIESKNYAAPVGKDEVLQLRDYLRRKSVGRFGLLVSRVQPSGAALQARRDTYAEFDRLILFIDDAALVEMLRLRRDGKDPAAVLQAMKQKFELAF
jgi:hypothetical protein